MRDNGAGQPLEEAAVWAQPLCGSCGNRICRLLAADAPAPRLRDLDRGERLSDTRCLGFWTVLDGLVALCTLLPDGRRQLVDLAAPGDILCPLSGAYGAEVWVQALAPSRLCEIDLSMQAHALDDDSALSAELFRIVHRQIKCTSIHLVTLGRLDGMERVCLFLTDMAWRVGVRSPKGWRVQLPLSREDIADYLGLNAETVSRIFSRVKKAKLVTFLSPTDYFVNDIEALQSRVPVIAPHSPQLEDGRRQEASPLCPM